MAVPYAPIVMRQILVLVKVGRSDATSRGVRLALMVLRGEMGYPSALTAKTWGFNLMYCSRVTACNSPKVTPAT
ncbi:MAG: hypothetical protein R3E08_05695 [Thiotrichaceae bacterium]